MLLPLLMACLSSEAPPPSETPSEQAENTLAQGTAPNVVVILIDTLREDALLRAETPHIDALRTSGSSSQHAWSAGTWTVPSIMSLFTGKSVREHGWDEPSARIGHYPVMGDHLTLAERLRSEGFETTGYYANPYLSEELGMERGFQTWKRSGDAQIPKLFERLVREQWASSDAPQFAYLHLIGPHSPLNPSPEARLRWQVEDSWFEGRRGLMIGAAKRNRRPGVREAYRKAYHAVIEDTDRRVGEIVEALRSVEGPTWILLTSDHGELLGEHNVVGHGSHVYQALTHIPFIVTPPEGQAPLVLPENLNNAALPSLVCQIAKLQCSFPTPVDPSLPLVSQREGMLALSPDGTQKGIWGPSPARFDLSTDPNETHPLPITASLDRAREAWLSETPPGGVSPEAISIDGENAERLRALGYQE